MAALLVELRVGESTAPEVEADLLAWLAGRQEPRADLQRIADAARRAGSPAGWLVHACRENLLDDVAFGAKLEPDGPADTSGPSARTPVGRRVSPRRWDFDLEREVALALSDDATRARTGRQALANRGGVTTALDRFQGFLDALGPAEEIEGTLHRDGIAGWRKAMPTVRERLENQRP